MKHLLMIAMILSASPSLSQDAGIDFVSTIVHDRDSVEAMDKLESNCVEPVAVVRVGTHKLEILSEKIRTGCNPGVGSGSTWHRATHATADELAEALQSFRDSGLEPIGPVWKRESGVSVPTFAIYGRSPPVLP